MKREMTDSFVPGAGHRSNAARNAFAIGAVSAIGLGVGAWIDVSQTLISYLFAYVCVMTVVLGALFIILISNLTGAAWFRSFRPLAFRIISPLPTTALLAIPILLGLSRLYPWTDITRLIPAVREVVERKEVWLNIPAFLARSIAYLFVWLSTAELLRRSDAARRGSYNGLLLMLVALSFTFACFDWMMSLDPTWYSTIYGVYVFAGGVLASVALISVARSALGDDVDDVDEAGERTDKLTQGGTKESSDKNGASLPLAKLILTFSMFWGYIAFSQYLIVWIADLPTEVTWYSSRASGSWGWFAVVIGLTQLVIPFVLLLSRKGKRSRKVVEYVCVLLLTGHVLDIYWLVMPAIYPSSISLSWTDPLALLSITGFTVATALTRSPVSKDAPLRHATDSTPAAAAL